MRKMSFVRYAAAAALASSAALAVVLPGGIAAAKGPKPPVTASCTDVVGTAADQLLVGCSSATGAKVTPEGVIVVGTSNPDSTINVTLTWLNKKFDTELVTLTGVLTGESDTCPTLAGGASAFEEEESSSVNGGTDKIAQGVPTSADACVYDGSGDYSIVVTGITGSPFTLG